MNRNRIEFRYSGTSHLILAYEHGARRKGETLIGGISSSTLRDFARRLTFLPAGHDYFEWHQLRTSARLLYVYFDPVELNVQSVLTSSSPLNPRLFFEDASLWGTLTKLGSLIESAGRGSLPYFEALGTVLMHELVRLDARARATARGGLAAWQQRLVGSYIEDHLSEHIPLATLASLVRLSPYHFSRAFKQSFGVPPHRYHTYRRIERAKLLLERHVLSVTDVGWSRELHKRTQQNPRWAWIGCREMDRFHDHAAGPLQNRSLKRGTAAGPGSPNISIPLMPRSNATHAITLE
jgi:AraC family transcriptional regulator